MSDPLIIRSTDPILSTLDFEHYHSIVERRVIPFFPTRDEPQTLEVDTPWGASLTASKGDLLASEVDTPNDYWPIDPVIFEESYVIIRPGYAIKRAPTLLVPLTALTNDPDREVTVVSLEGATTVRAGDFFLAKGVKGEIWAFPKEKMETMMPDAVFQKYKKKSDRTSPE
jgi:hypothetical protein